MSYWDTLDDWSAEEESRRCVPGTNAQHGKRSTYQKHKCRCVECRASNSRYMQPIMNARYKAGLVPSRKKA